MRLVTCGVLAFSLCALLPAAAQTPAEFYRGKTIDISVGFSAGGAYDVYARLIARLTHRECAEISIYTDRHKYYCQRVSECVQWAPFLGSERTRSL